VFFDDGYAQYLDVNMLHQVYDQSKSLLPFFCTAALMAENMGFRCIVNVLVVVGCRVIADLWCSLDTLLSTR